MNQIIFKKCVAKIFFSLSLIKTQAGLKFEHLSCMNQSRLCHNSSNLTNTLRFHPHNTVHIHAPSGKAKVTHERFIDADHSFLSLVADSRLRQVLTLPPRQSFKVKQQLYMVIQFSAAAGTSEEEEKPFRAL